MTKICDICGGNRRIRLPTQHRELSVAEIVGDTPPPPDVVEAWREFDCPQCVKLVPYRRVRAARVVTKVDYEQFGKYQNPIERGLAQQFGAYLHREGLIKFGADNLDDPSARNITVSAELNIVAPANAAGAPVLVIDTDPPPLPRKLTRQASERQRNGEITTGYSINSAPVPWEPQVFKPPVAPKTKREMLQEAAAERAGISDRFSGIDFDDAGEFD